MNWIQDLAKASIFVLACHTGFAQCDDVVWPKDTALAQEARLKIVQLHDAHKARDYRKATNALTWLARNAPRADTGLYRQADRIYSELLERERNSTVKQLYLDSIYRFYDLRLRDCDKSFDVDEARAIALYRHFVADQPQMVRKALDSM